MLQTERGQEKERAKEFCVCCFDHGLRQGEVFFFLFLGRPKEVKAESVSIRRGNNKEEE